MVACPSCRRPVRLAADGDCPFCRSGVSVGATLGRVKTAVGVGLTTLVLSACYGPIDTDKPSAPTGETGDTAPTTETTAE